MGRTPCCDKNGLKKGPWTAEEDQKLVDYIQKHGYGNWRTLPKNAGLQRCGKSCRLRWTNYLRPDIKRGRFTFEEEETIIQLHSILGNKWSAIASRLPGRTDNEIKNYWNTHIRKRLLRMGIDPVTHSPRLDLLDISAILSSSLYNTSQMNMSRFHGIQPLVNPELLKLASSLVSLQRGNQNSSCTQNSQDYHHQLYNRYPQLDNHMDQIQELQPCSSLSTPGVSYPLNDTQYVEANAEGYPSSIDNFSDWQGNGNTSGLAQDYVPIPSYNVNYSIEQSILDPAMCETSAFHTNSSNRNLGFTSVLSTPSSSPTPLHSHSTYVNSCSSTEDERESYGSNKLLKFDIPAMLDMNYEIM